MNKAKFNENIGKLNASISIPSYENSYSIAIGYMRDWFMSKFNKDYFKHFHLVGKHVMDDFRRFNINETLVKETPALAMRPEIDFDYNRDNIDLYEFGIDNYVRRSGAQKAFFKDTKKNIYVALEMEQMRMNCEYRIKLSERAQQLRIYKFLQLALRVGATQSNYISVDFHIPYSIMIQVARDAGFEIKDKEIVDKVAFLNYFNLHSQVPTLLKYSNMTGRVEYFLRFNQLYTHIAVANNIQVDDGEQVGKIMSSFMLEAEAELLFPCPKMYIYYSTNEHNEIDPTNTMHESNVSMDICTIKIPKVADYNDKGWELQLTTDIEEEDLDKPLVIPLDQMFANSDILRVIQYNNSIMISSDIFLDFKLYNDGEKVDFDINWKDLTIVSKVKLRSYITNMYVYINMKYLNEQRITVNRMYDNRIVTNLKQKED